MFSKLDKKESANITAISRTVTESGDIPSIIASDLRIVGNLACAGSLEIEGSIEGNVSCKNITIRRSGKIMGDVVADQVQVDGEVNGLVKGTNVILSDTARVTGIIMYESLSVQDGAFIDGQCKSCENTVHKGKVETLEIDSKESANDDSGDSSSAVIIEDEPVPARRSRRRKS